MCRLRCFIPNCLCPTPCSCLCFLRELDLKILQEALSKEAADEAAELAFRERRREEMRRYREQLALMMEKEREETAERDALILKAQLEQEAKRDAELAARDEARRQLMAQVDAIRQIQIQEKLAKRCGLKLATVLEPGHDAGYANGCLMTRNV